MSLTMTQLSGRSSLRDIVDNLGAQAHRLYHLDSTKLSKTTLGWINKNRPYTLYEALFGKLLKRCQGATLGHGFRFKNTHYSLYALTIDLCLSAFPWADFRTTKRAAKLRVALNHGGYLPEFITITEGKTHDVVVGRTLAFPKSSLVAVNRDYNDYHWSNQLAGKGIYFVTRLKSNAKTRIVTRRRVVAKFGVSSDHTIEFTGAQTAKKSPVQLRRIGYRNAETGKRHVFLTTHFKLSATTIADIYKALWQVELFSKWIKQNLKIKSFVGTSKNAVMTQIWIAMCVYLLLAFLKFQSQATKSMQQILRLFQLNLFEKRDLLALMRGDPPEDG